MPKMGIELVTSW